MKVTAKADYAVRAVLELAAADGALVKADRIAEAQAIPRHFLDNILTDPSEVTQAIARYQLGDLAWPPADPRRRAGAADGR